MKRRDFMRTAGGSAAATTAVVASSGTATAQEEIPEWDYIDGVDGGEEDLRGQDEVTVTVGAPGNGGDLAFEPAGIWIDPGTTVIWEWTGDGGEHNVETVDGPADLDSELTAEAGFTYEHEFTEDDEGITDYVCAPHEGLDMKGAVAVGDDVPTAEAAAGDTGWPEDFAGEVGVPLQKHYIGIISFLGIAVSLVFTFYVLKYGESPNTGQGDS